MNMQACIVRLRALQVIATAIHTGVVHSVVSSRFCTLEWFINSYFFENCKLMAIFMMSLIHNGATSIKCTLHYKVCEIIGYHAWAIITACAKSLPRKKEYRRKC